MKVLSFIIPAYNSEQYLKNCISSLLNEKTLLSVEIIIVNDGSTDKTEDIALDFAKRYPQTVKVISQENRGHGGSLNTGCLEASGKYFKVIDADDTIVTENLPLFIETLEKIDADVVLTHHYTKNIATGEIKKWMTYPQRFGAKYSIEQINESFGDFDRGLTLHGITYKTEFYKMHNYRLTERVFYEDHEYSTFPCCFAKSVLPLNIFIYVYRIGDLSQSVSEQSKLKRKEHTEAVLERFIAEYKTVTDKEAQKHVCLKTKILLISYLTTLLLAEKDRNAGRLQAEMIMTQVSGGIPMVAELVKKQYGMLRLMNRLGIKKAVLDKIISTKLYRKIKGNHEFN